MKKNITSILGAIFLGLASQWAWAHPGESRVAIESDVVAPVSAGQVRYVFELVDTKLNKVLKDTDLTIFNQKLLHIVVYDPALKEFQHVHSDFDGRYWKVTLDFAVNGEYWLWAQGMLTVDGEEFSSSTRITVEGGRPAWPTPATLADSRQGSDGSSTVVLGTQRLGAGTAAMLDVNLGRNDGSQPVITPYLGSFAHIIAVSDDGDSILHVHLMDGAQPNQGMAHLTFPSAGFYRLWVQFVDGGNLKTVPLSVQVF